MLKEIRRIDTYKFNIYFVTTPDEINVHGAQDCEGSVVWDAHMANAVILLIF